MVWSLDTASIADRLFAVDPIAVAAALPITLAVSMLHAARWSIVVRANDGRLPWLGAVRLTLIGYFFNQTLPSTLGGDAFRIWGAYRAGLSLTDAASSVILDRLVALATLLLMIAVTTPWLFEFIPPGPMRWAILTIVAGGTAGFAALLYVDRVTPSRLRWRRAEAGGIALSPWTAAPADPPQQRADDASDGACPLHHCGGALHACRGMQVDVSLFHCVLIFPLVMIVSVLPVSIAGWGVREGAMVVSLGLLGVDAAAAFSLSILFGLVNHGGGHTGRADLGARGRTADAKCTRAPAG